MSLLREDNGNLSTSRILSYLIVLSGLSIGIIATIVGTLNANTVTLSVTLVGIGYTGKVISKGLEK